MRTTSVYIFFVSIILTGCSSKPSSLVASTSPIPPGIRGTIPTHGSNCQTFFLGLIPLTGSPDSQDALEEAKERIDVDVLTDVTIDHGGIYVILFSTDCVRVRGKGVPRDMLRSYDWNSKTTFN